MQNAARSGQFDLIVAVGFLIADAMAEVAGQFPDQKFAIIESKYNRDYRDPDDAVDGE